MAPPGLRSVEPERVDPASEISKLDGTTADVPHPIPEPVRDLWGNGVWFAGTGLVLLLLALLLLIRPPDEGGLILGWILAGGAGLLLGLAVFGFWSLRVWRSRLRLRGVEWEPDRTLIPVVQQTVPVPLPREAALSLAYAALRNSRDRTQGVVGFSGVKRTRDGLVAYRGPSLALALLTRGSSAAATTTIRVQAEDRGTATRLRITVWPFFQAQGEAIADDVIAAIHAQMGS